MTTERFGRPLVSVGMPVFNGERFLERAIDSVLAQSVEDLEVVLVDNASTDGTAEICKAAAARDGRVRHFLQASNVGAAANFNHALELAHGEFFCWLAHDDWMAPDYLRRCIDGLASEPGFVLCSALMVVTDWDGQVVRRQRELLIGADHPSPRRRYHSMLWTLRDPTAPVFGVTRTSTLRAAGGIPTVPEPDRQLLYHLALRGRLKVVHDELFFHFGPRGHMFHYGAGKLRRRSWDWLHAPGQRRRPKVSTLRVLDHQMRLVVTADMELADKVLCALSLLSATALRRTKSKLRRVIRARRRGLRSLDRAYGESVQSH